MKEHGQEAQPVAEAVGLSWAQMYRRLRGEGCFTLMQARAIARYLRVPYEELFPGHSGVDEADIIAQRVAEAGSPGTWCNREGVVAVAEAVAS